MAGDTVSAALVLGLSPRVATRPVRQALAFRHVLYAPGWRSEDAQLLVVPSGWCRCAGLMFGAFIHERP